MFYDHNITVVIPAYNEADTIADVVRDFRSVNCVDRVIVVDNNCKDATADLAREAGAEVIAESAAGYGCALRAGMNHAVELGADILVLTEADGSFRGMDLWKLAYYLLDANMVLGTRNTKQMVVQGANMDAMLRWGQREHGEAAGDVLAAPPRAATHRCGLHLPCDLGRLLEIDASRDDRGRALLLTRDDL